MYKTRKIKTVGPYSKWQWFVFDVGYVFKESGDGSVFGRKTKQEKPQTKTGRGKVLSLISLLVSMGSEVTVPLDENMKVKAWDTQ